MTPNQAVIQASKAIVAANGLVPHARLLKELSWTQGAQEPKIDPNMGMNWRDYFARCFAVEEGPNLGRFIQSALKEMDVDHKSESLVDLLDQAQGRCVRFGRFEAALGLESLREEAERLFGAPLSSYGLGRGLMPIPQASKSSYAAELRLGYPTAPAQALALEMARLSERASHQDIRFSDEGGRNLTDSERAEQVMLRESLASSALMAAWMDQSAQPEQLEKSMEAARVCAQAGAEIARGRELEGEPECSHARALEIFAGRLCARLLAKGASYDWLYDEHGIVWSESSASLIEGLGSAPVRALFWMGLESESMLISSEENRAASGDERSAPKARRAL